MDRGLLVGINAYPGNELQGCVNDVTDMAEFLVSHCGFNENDIRLLTDGRATTEAIMEHLKWLMSGAKSGDRVVFHYSGHGAQFPIRDQSGKVTRVDECICPVDFSILSSSAGTPSGLFRPSLLSRYALRTGFARYAPRCSLWERSWRLSSRVLP